MAAAWGGMGLAPAGPTLSAEELTALSPAERLAALTRMGREFSAEDYELLSSLDEMPAAPAADDDFDAARQASVIAAIRCIPMPDLRGSAAASGAAGDTQTVVISDNEEEDAYAKAGSAAADSVIVIDNDDDDHGDDDDDVAIVIDDASPPLAGGGRARTAPGRSAPPSQPGPNENCSICLEDMPVRSLIKMLPCHHRFHPTCIDRWLVISKLKCPVCKQSALPEPQSSRARPIRGGKR